MHRWAEFAREAPEFAGAGERLLRPDGGVMIGFLATVGADGTPHIAPVCPIAAEGALYLSAGAGTPKIRDLVERRRYVLHAFLGEGDEEFQITGDATLIEHADERARVHAAITFQYGAEDPIFRLDVERCLWAHWVKPGQPGTYPVKRRWPDP